MPDPSAPIADIDAERALCGCLMHGASGLPEALQYFRPADCWDRRYRLIVETAISLMQAGTTVNGATIAEAIRDRSMLNEFRAGDRPGMAFFTELTGDAFSDAWLVPYAKRIKRAAIDRTIAFVSDEARRDCLDQVGDPVDRLAEYQRRLAEVMQTAVTRQDVGIGDVISESVNEIVARDGRPEGLATGLEELDKIIRLKPGRLVVLAARPSVGKTALAMQITAHVALENPDQALLFVSLEMGRSELGERILSCHASVSGEALSKGNLPTDWMELHARFAATGLRLDDDPRQTTLSIASKARALAAGGKLGLVVIDYLQLVEPADRRVNRNEQIAAMSREFKQLAGSLNVPVLLLSQLNRQPAGRQDNRPYLSDLRDSGSIEQDADIVLMLYRPDDDDKKRVRCEVAKHRGGRVGIVELQFVPHSVRFEAPQPDWSHAQPSDGF